MAGETVSAAGAVHGDPQQSDPTDDQDTLVAVLLWSGRGLLLLLLLLGAAANALALLAYCRGPGLRTLSNRFVMNLLVVNLVACASLLPLLLLDSATSMAGGAALCSISEGVAAGYCTASILGVLLIAGMSSLRPTAGVATTVLCSVK